MDLQRTLVSSIFVSFPSSRNLARTFRPEIAISKLPNLGTFALHLSNRCIIFDRMKLTTQDEMLRSELVERLQMIERPDLLQEVRAILDKYESKKDFWDELTPKQQAMVRKGMEELKDGKGIPAEEVMRKLKK